MANRHGSSNPRAPVHPLYKNHLALSQSTPTLVPAPAAARWPKWTTYLPQQLPRLAFPMFCVVACTPSAVVIAVPVVIWAFGLPGLSGLTLGVLAFALTWGGLAILMRYQEMWESAPPAPHDPWLPPSFDGVAVPVVIS